MTPYKITQFSQKYLTKRVKSNMTIQTAIPLVSYFTHKLRIALQQFCIEVALSHIVLPHIMKIRKKFVAE